MGTPRIVKKKQRVKVIDPKLRTYITELALKDRKRDRGLVADEVIEYITKNGYFPLQKETIEKIISKARNHEISPIDKPWSLASLPQNPISPEALPIVLEVKVLKDILSNWSDPLSIRQAHWIARLYKLFKVDNIVDMYLWSQKYADSELAYEVVNINLNVSDLDINLIHKLGKQIAASLNMAYGKEEDKMNKALSDIGNNPFLKEYGHIRNKAISEMEEGTFEYELYKDGGYLSRYRPIGELTVQERVADETAKILGVLHYNKIKGDKA